MNYTFFATEKQGNTLWLWLNRPERRNFLNLAFWEELPLIVEEAQRDDTVRVLVIAAKGTSFSMGLDIREFSEKFRPLFVNESAKVRQEIFALIQKMQMGIIKLLDFEKPVVAAIHRHCIGGGLDLVACADVRFCSEDAIFSLKESQLHIVADMGSLQILPYIIGEAKTREWAFSGRDILAAEAFAMGLVNQVYASKEELWQNTLRYCEELCQKDALVLKGIKFILNQRRNFSIKKSLQEVALYNSAFLQNDSFIELIKSISSKK